MQLVVQYFITLIILWYHNMVGNCKLIIKPLNLIDIRILYSLFRKFEIFFHMFEYYWNSNILLVFNTRILIQILNQKPRIVYIQKIFRIIITILSTENRILTLIPRIIDSSTILNFLDRHSATTNFFPSLPRSQHFATA